MSFIFQREPSRVELKSRGVIAWIFFASSRTRRKFMRPMQIDAGTGAGAAFPAEARSGAVCSLGAEPLISVFMGWQGSHLP